MRTKLLSGLLAAFLAVTIVVGGTARPARAAVPWAQIAVAVASYLFSGGGGGSNGLEQAKQEIIAAINTSRQDILNHIDRIANADVRACTEASTTLVAQIDLMDPFTLAAFVISAVNCASLSSSYLDAVQDQAAADNIGKLMGTIYSIAMVGFTKLGFPTVDLLDSLIRGYESALTKIVPTCTFSSFKEQGGRIEEFYACRAYNGDEAVANRVRPARITAQDRTWAENMACRNTVRGIAQNALPTLRALRATMP